MKPEPSSITQQKNTQHGSATPSPLSNMSPGTEDQLYNEVQSESAAVGATSPFSQNAGKKPLTPNAQQFSASSVTQQNDDTQHRLPTTTPLFELSKRTTEMILNQPQAERATVGANPLFSGNVVEMPLVPEGTIWSSHQINGLIRVYNAQIKKVDVQRSFIDVQRSFIDVYRTLATPRTNKDSIGKKKVCL